MATKRKRPAHAPRFLTERVSARLGEGDVEWLGERASALRLTVSDVLRMMVWRARTRGETFSDVGPTPDAARKGGV